MLTYPQKQLLEFIQTYQAARGYAPSFSEMMAALNLRSKSGIHRLLTGLEERGHIRRLRYRSRAIEVIRSPHLTDKPLALSNVALLAECQRRGFAVGVWRDNQFVELAPQARRA